MATLTNVTKNSAASMTNVSQSAPGVSEYNLMIDDTYFLLIDDTYKLNIQDEASGTELTNVSKN